MTPISGAVTGVVFDMGGVLTVDPFQACRDYADELGLPTKTFVDCLRGPIFAEVETGERSVRDFLKFVCVDVEERHGVRVDIRRLSDCLAAGQQVRPAMVTLIGDLTANGVKVGVLTNNAREAKAWWTSGVLPVGDFTAIVDSSEIGMRKPDPAIFAVTAQRMGCRPAQLLYFDDLMENVSGARSVEFDAHVFTDPETCRSTCRQAGLL